jgi:16S rRNA (guanine(527)-N(7))-methyltransferase RsmG
LRVMFHVKLEGTRPRLPGGPRERSLFLRYHDLLRDRAIPAGIVASSDSGRLMDRHIVDSLRALRCLRSSDRHVVDLGSGAGLPGIPLAIALPDVLVTLVEPRRSRAAFLEFVIENLRLTNASVKPLRADGLALDADACTARGVASPEESYRLARPLLRPEGTVLYFAGASWREGQGAARLATEGIRGEICDPPVFPWQGPVVMMRPLESVAETKEIADPRS